MEDMGHRFLAVELVFESAALLDAIAAVSTVELWSARIARTI